MALQIRLKSKHSIKQGDPLAPLIFIMITDALHEGLRRIPIFADEPCRPRGYRFLCMDLIISSIAFADDLYVFAES